MASARHKLRPRLRFQEGNARGSVYAILTFQPDRKKLHSARYVLWSLRLKIHIPVWAVGGLIASLSILLFPGEMLAFAIFILSIGVLVALVLRCDNSKWAIIAARRNAEMAARGERYSLRVESDWARFAKADDVIHSLVIDWLLTKRDDRKAVHRINNGQKIVSTLSMSNPVRESVLVEIQALHGRREALATALQETENLLRTEISRYTCAERRAEEVRKQRIAAQARAMEQRKRYNRINDDEQTRYFRQQQAQGWLDNDA